MTKKLLLFMMWALAAFPLMAQETLTVAQGNATNSKVPIYGFSCDTYLKCEYVLDRSSLGDLTGGTITGLTWSLKQPAIGSWGRANFKVFLKEVGSTSLTTFSGPTGGTVVYEGSIDGTHETINLEFSTPYEYGGGHLLVGVYNTVPGAYKGCAFLGVNVSGSTLQGSDYFGLESVAGEAVGFIPQTTFTYTPAEGDVFYAPNDLVVDNITPNSASLTWSPGGEETAWKVGYKKHNSNEWTVETVTTTSYELDALTRGTTYDVTVTSVYPRGESAPVSAQFTTLACDEADMAEISYELGDAYSDGWSGNHIQVVLHETGAVVEDITLPSGASSTGTLRLCYGETYDFIWGSNYYGEECSFTFTDAEGNVILEHASGTAPEAGLLISYMPERVQFLKPKNMTVSNVRGTTAMVAWETAADSSTLRYRESVLQECLKEGFEKGLTDGWEIVDNDGDGYTWEVVQPASFQVEGITAHSGKNVMMSRSYINGLDIAPDNWLILPQVPLGGQLEYWISDNGDYAENYAIYVSTTGTDISDFSSVTGDLSSPKSTAWVKRTVDLSAYAGKTGYIAFRNYNTTDGDIMFIDDIRVLSVNGEEHEWTMKENVNSPYTVTDLKPNTDYEVAVRANYDGGVSDWTDTQVFTTVDVYVLPTRPEVSEVTDSSAKVEWTGPQEEYKVRYRKAAQREGFYEGFENGIPSDWTILDADGDGNSWYLFDPEEAGTEKEDIYGNPVVIGNRCASSASYNGNILTPDNWLITPQVALDGKLSVWMRGQDPRYYLEHFAIYASTTGTSIEDFTYVLLDTTTARPVFTEYTCDLSEFEGQMGYIAIRHFDVTDEFYLNVDDFIIANGTEIPAGEWTEQSGVLSPYTITGLEPTTEYEVQVSGFMATGYGYTPWTESTLFTTLERAGSIYDINGDGNVNTGDVSELYRAILGGMTDSKYDLNGDGNVNTGDISELYQAILAGV